MVPVISPSHIEARATLRTRITESCRRDLSKVFVAWLLQEPERSAEFASIAARAAQREGADQDFQTIAILGFAADVGLLSELQVEALKNGLSRLAGRSPMVNGVPMAFCADAAGILGVALGTRSIKDPVVTGQVVGWATKFLRTSYERSGADDWQRCLFAVADRQLGGSLGLAVPESAATGDVRTALAAKGIIDVGDGKQAREDAAQTLALANQEPPKDFAYDRAALRLAAVEWVIRTLAADVNGVFAKTPTAAKVGRPGAEAIDGKLVRKIRGGLKQEDFANRCGISVDVLQTAEIKGRATEATIDKICRAAKANGMKLKGGDLKKIVPPKPPK